MMQVNCYDCKHIDFDVISGEEYVSCLKSHDLLMSMEIPDNCKDFSNDFGVD